MKTVIYTFVIILTLFNIFFAAYPLFQGEIHFFNDVARDFHLLRELNEKKVILIGPRSNASGLFHGPLWTYINFPAFFLGRGNPVISGWFWIFLEIAALTIGFIGVKKLFGKLPGLIFMYLYSYSFITHINSMFHSDAPVFLTPFLYLSAVFYATNKKFIFLFIHLLTAVMILQLNVGVGIPILILSVLMSLILISRNRNWKHLIFLFLLPVMLSNFIIFDLRHENLLSKSAYEFWQFQKSWTPTSLEFLLRNRLESTLHLQFYYSENFYLALFIFLAVFISSVREIISKKRRTEYLIMIYFYLGYMLLSFTNKGVILSHFIYLLVGITSVWFASFFKKRYLRLFFPVLVILIFLNFRHAFNYAQELKTNYIGKNFQSWRSMSEVADTIIKKQKGESFGYFVFAPDAFAYGPRYAMIYNFEAFGVDAFEYTKKPVTWIVAEPPPKNDPYMTYVWWRKNPVKIIKEPSFTKQLKSGFTVEEYQLSDEEQKILHDKTIELGIHFR